MLLVLGDIIDASKNMQHAGGRKLSLKNETYSDVINYARKMKNKCKEMNFVLSATINYSTQTCLLKHKHIIRDR